MLDDLGRHFEQSFIAALQAFHKPPCLLQLFFDIPLISGRAALEHGDIVIVHP